MIKRKSRYATTQLASLFHSCLLEGDFDAYNGDVEGFLNDLRISEIECAPVRYQQAHKEFWHFLNTDKEALARIIEESDFPGILTFPNAYPSFKRYSDVLEKRLKILFPK